MIRLFRDGYNRTNLEIGHYGGPIHLVFSAVNEPWDGPGIRVIIAFGRRWLRWDAAWGRMP